METTRKNESGNHTSPNGIAVWAALFWIKGSKFIDI